MLNRRQRLFAANNGGGNLRRQLLDSAPFLAQLTHSLVLQRGTGSPTFTRATTKTVENNDGYLVTLLAGEIGFVGARRIYNLWTTSSVSLANGANKSLTLSAGTYAFSMGAGTGTATFSGTGGATGTLAASASGRVSVNKTISAGTFVVTASVADLADLQVESLTAQTTQTAGEYVSVGVESAPYYHGSFVDGVKCFPTDLSGNPIPAATMLGYQAHGARTNLCLQSQDFTTTWIVNVTTVSANAAVAPDGTTTADLVYPDSSGVNRYVYQTGLTTTAAAWTFSFFAKYSGIQWAYCIDLTGSTYAAYFDLQNGVVGTVAAGHSASIEDFGDGWYRCKLTTTTAPAGAAAVYIGMSDADNSSSVTANSTDGLYLWGAQVELGSFASSYIATTTAAVTRNAEIDAYSTASNITAAAGYISLQFTPTHTPSGTIALWGTYVDASNYTAILHDATNLIFRKRIAGSNYDATIANAFVSGTTYKMAATWGAAGTSIALDGTLGTGHANTTAAQIAATMQFGADGNSLQQPFASVGAGYIGQRQLSASELQAITA